MIFTPRGKANINLAITYLGLKKTEEVHTSGPQFRLDLEREGDMSRIEVEVNDSLEATTLLAEFAPKLPPKSIYLMIRIVTSSADMVRVQLVTTMRMREVQEDAAVAGQSSGTFMVTDCGQRATQARVELGYVDGERFNQAASGAIPDFPEPCSGKSMCLEQKRRN